MEADDLDGAVEAMEEAFALADQSELELPPGLRFRHARLAFAVGLLGAAKESVTGYLTAASREAEAYRDAVALLEDLDGILERRDAPECAPEPTDSACWMELASRPGCYAWNPNPQPDETATWSGECSAGFAQGPGTLTWTTRAGSQQHEGNRRYGQPHGESVIRDTEGWVDEGPYRFGKLHGAWIERTADGGVLEGSYVDGEENGSWILKFADGGAEEGSFVDGRRHGHWILTFSDGQVEEGPYVDGERHGRWVVRPADGDTFYVTFVRGVRQER